jgi:hypothetical protein
VTRGTRPKKPSSSRGFAREARKARGVWGFWGLKTENRKLKIDKNFSLSKPARTTKKNLLLFYFIFRVRANGYASARTHCRIRADASACARTPLVFFFTPGNFKKDATVRLSHGRPRGHRPIVRPSVRNVRVTTLMG